MPTQWQAARPLCLTCKKEIHSNVYAFCPVVKGIQAGSAHVSAQALGLRRALHAVMESEVFFSLPPSFPARQHLSPCKDIRARAYTAQQLMLCYGACRARAEGMGLVRARRRTNARNHCKSSHEKTTTGSAVRQCTRLKGKGRGGSSDRPAGRK